jgi:hypothetical protein
MKAIRILALLLIALLVINPIVPVQAGTMEKEISLLVDGQLNNTDWYDAEGSTFTEGDKLLFSADGLANSRVISKTIAQEDQVYKTMFTLNAQVQITELPENEKFIIALGLDSIEALSAEPGNVEIEITNDGALKMAVVHYDENGEASVIAKQKAIKAKVGDTITLKMTASTDGRCGTRVFCGTYEITVWSGGKKTTVTRDIHRESFYEGGGKERICIEI